MSRRVLLVDADVNALGALASALRARGLAVSIASEAFDAVEQAFQMRPEAVLVARSLDGSEDLAAALHAVPELSDTPVLYVVHPKDERELGPRDVPRTDLDRIISRIADVSPRSSAQPLDQELRGNLEQMPLVDLLQMLSMNRRSGVLGVTTVAGAGEVRLSEGEIADAVYRRHEGEKAFYRLLGEREGRFAFSPGPPKAARRIASPTSVLLMEAMRQVDEVKRLRKELSPAGEALLVEELSGARTIPLAIDLTGEQMAIGRELVSLLQIPRSLDELLDELPATDLAILEAASRLAGGNKVRRIPITDLTTPFAPVEQLPVLRSLVVRLTRPGFAPPPRLVIAAGLKRLPVLAHAIRRITDAVAPTDAAPSAALPRTLGTLRLGDGVELLLTGLPTDERFAPMWALTLPGAAAVVRLNDAGGAALEAHCSAVEVMLIDAESVMGSLDVAVPGQVAALVRSALEVAAGV